MVTGLWVVVRTSQGRASWDIRVPAVEMVSATSSAVNPRRDRPG